MAKKEFNVLLKNFKNATEYRFSTKRNTKNYVIHLFEENSCLIIQRMLLLNSKEFELADGEFKLLRKFKDHILIERHINISEDSLRVFQDVLSHIEREIDQEKEEEI